MITPPQRLPQNLRMKLKQTMSALADALNITGAFNIQALIVQAAQGATIKVIETNLRNSRSLPFVSKAVGLDFASEAVRAMITARTRAEISETERNRTQGMLQTCDSFAFGATSSSWRTGVKSAKFSWRRVPGSDPGDLGVDMRSTGEVA